MERYNHEHYPDPTAYQALTKIQQEERRKKPVVFICSPYAGDIEGNVMRAKRYGRFAVTQKVIPVIPHLMYTQFLYDEDPVERKLGLEMGLVLLTKCSELWVFGERVSSGMQAEIRKAKQRNMTIRYFSVGCKPIEEVTDRA